MTTERTTQCHLLLTTLPRGVLQHAPAAGLRVPPSSLAREKEERGVVRATERVLTSRPLSCLATGCCCVANDCTEL